MSLRSRHSSLMARWPTGSSFAMESMSGAGRQHRVTATEKRGLAHAEFSIYDDRGLLAEELTVTGQGGAERSLYDVRGSLIYHAHYFQGYLMLEAIQYYDPLGRLKESRFSGSGGGLMRKHLDRYNQAG